MSSAPNSYSCEIFGRDQEISGKEVWSDFSVSCLISAGMRFHPIGKLLMHLRHASL